MLRLLFSTATFLLTIKVLGTSKSLRSIDLIDALLSRVYQLLLPSCSNQSLLPTAPRHTVTTGLPYHTRCSTFTSLPPSAVPNLLTGSCSRERVCSRRPFPTTAGRTILCGRPAAAWHFPTQTNADAAAFPSTQSPESQMIQQWSRLRRSDDSLPDILFLCYLPRKGRAG